MNGETLHFGPHPVVPRFSPMLSDADHARVDALACRIRAAEPGLDSTEFFGPGVTVGLEDLPSLHIHDVEQHFQGDIKG